MHLVILAAVQGLTEFLPVSSSGHLVLVHHVYGGDEADRWTNDLMLDVAVHVGTLLSVLVYFRRDIWAMIQGVIQALCIFIPKIQKRVRGVGSDTDSNDDAHYMRLALLVVLASIPVVVAGLILHIVSPIWIRSVEVMAWSTIIFGVLLWFVDTHKPAHREIESLHVRDALFIGFAQVLALVPGTSRSGITMTAARALGLSRTEAARFSLFLSIFAILGAGVIGGMTMYQNGDMQLTYHVFIAMFLAFLFGWASIAMMMRWLTYATFKVFGLYRVALGSILLVVLYSNGFV